MRALLYLLDDLAVAMWVHVTDFIASIPDWLSDGEPK